MYRTPHEISLDRNGIELVRSDEHSSAENGRDSMEEDEAVIEEDLVPDGTTGQEDE
jgi:hypothetical protein